VTDIEGEKRRSWPDRGRAVSFGNGDDVRARLMFRPEDAGESM